MISKKTIIISVIIIALLVGAYFIVDFIGSDSVSETGSGDEGSKDVIDTSSANDHIFQADKDSIVSVAITNSEGSYEFVLNGETWIAAEDESVLYNQALVNSLVLDYVTVTPMLVVEESAENAASFGLENPAATSVVKTNDGKTGKFYLGDKTKGGNGYYFMMDGKDAVYTISTVIGDNMQKKLSEFRDKSLISVDASEITEVSMSVVGTGDVNLVHLDDQADATSSWKMTKPFDIGVYEEHISELIITPLLSVQAFEFLTDNPTAEQLLESGFDNPQFYYQIKTVSGEVIRVEIGNNYDGLYVVRRTDKPTVYLVDANAFSFMYVDVVDYIYSFAYLPNHDSVSEIVCNAKSSDYSLVSGGDKFSINGKEISSEKYSEYYQKVFGVNIQGIVTTPPENYDDVLLSYSVTKTDGTVDKIDFINMNSKYAYMSVNGKADFYVFTESVNQIESAMAELLEYSENPVGEESEVESDEASEGFNWLALVIAVLVILLIASFPVSLLMNSKKKK